MPPIQIASWRPQRRREDAAQDRAERDRAPHDEPHRRVHPALHRRRRDRLAEAHLVDVVDDAGEAAEEARGDEERRPAQRGRREGDEQQPGPLRTRSTATIVRPDADPAREPVRGERARRAKPTLPRPKTMPISLGASPSSRTRYRIRIANAMLLKRFEVPGRGRDAAQVLVAEHVAEADGDLLAHRRLAACPCSSTCAIRRRLLPPDQEHEERRHDVADRVEQRSRTAPSGRRSGPPPSAGPGDLRDRPGDLELASCPRRAGRDRPATAGSDWYATSKNTVRRAVDEADDVELPDRQGVEGEGDRDRGEATARPRSPTMRIGRRRRRSTQTPAGRLSRMNGRNSIVAEQRRTRTASRRGASPRPAGARAG